MYVYIGLVGLYLKYITASLFLLEKWKWRRISELEMKGKEELQFGLLNFMLLKRSFYVRNSWMFLPSGLDLQIFLPVFHSISKHMV